MFLPILILKATNKICSKRHSIFYFIYFSEKTSLDISCESSAWQMIHMKCQDLFSLKNKKKKNKKKLLSAAVAIGALRVKGGGIVFYWRRGFMDLNHISYFNPLQDFFFIAPDKRNSFLTYP